MNKILHFLIIFAFLGCATKTSIDKPTKSMDNDEIITNAEFIKEKISPKGFGVKFFGDSHTASGDLVLAFRDEFFGQDSVDSVGFVPALMPKYHSHSLVKFTQVGFEIISSRTEQNPDFPLCGVIATAKNGASIDINLKKFKGKFGVEILHKFDKKDVIFELKDAGGKSYKILQKTPNSWEYSTFLLEFPIKISALKAGAQIGGYKIYKNSGFVDACATNGAYSTISAKWAQSAWSRDFKGFDYKLFVIAYGTNDALDRDFSEQKFTKSIKALMDKLRKNSPNAKFVLVSPPPSPKVKKANLASSALKKLAKKENAIFVDIKTLIDSDGGWAKWQKMGLIRKDNIHFSHEGYAKIGKFIAQKVKEKM